MDLDAAALSRLSYTSFLSVRVRVAMVWHSSSLIPSCLQLKKCHGSPTPRKYYYHMKNNASKFYTRKFPDMQQLCSVMLSLYGLVGCVLCTTQLVLIHTVYDCACTSLHINMLKESFESIYYIIYIFAKFAV